MARKKKRTISAAKKRVDKWFSKYIRLRDADSKGYVKCVTCWKPMYWKTAQNGHYIPRARGNAALFMEDNCHPQCNRCNGFLEGNSHEYRKYINSRYGDGYADKIAQKCNQVKRWTMAELDELEEHYKLQVKRLMKQKG